jgi:hypothetical protein
MALGPNYVYADELATPSEIGVRRDGSFGGIARAVAGVNYYADAIGFGQTSGLAKNEFGADAMYPLGIRYFIKTGLTCSNGADMYDYVDGIPKPLPGRVGKEVEQSLGVKFRGLAPGMVQDATGALNPVPLFQAAIGAGYPKCKKVTLPVGDYKGNVRSRYDQKNVWITEPSMPVRVNRGSLPHQTRWVLDSYITPDEYNAAPKTEKPNTLPATESLSNMPEGFVGSSDSSSTVAAGVLFAALVLGLAVTASRN